MEISWNFVSPKKWEPCAGEVVGGTHVRKPGSIHPVPDYVQELNSPEGNLKDTCRRAIRKHLMELSPVNLFCKIPQLGLPKLMEDYLLYGITLDASDASDETYNYRPKRKTPVGSATVTRYGRTSRRPERFSVCQ